MNCNDIQTIRYNGDLSVLYLLIETENYRKLRKIVEQSKYYTIVFVLILSLLTNLDVGLIRV